MTLPHAHLHNTYRPMAIVPTVPLTTGRILLRLRAKMIWPLAPPPSISILKDTAQTVQLTFSKLKALKRLHLTILASICLRFLSISHQTA